MNAVVVYLSQLLVTLLISLGVVAWLRPYLGRVLLELCGTAERADFWQVFSSILLVGMPLIFGLGYNPLEAGEGMLFYAAAGQVRANLLGFLLALIGIGFVVSFFALVAPRGVGQAEKGWA